jgi:hypothetical protein
VGKKVVCMVQKYGPKSVIVPSGDRAIKM